MMKRKKYKEKNIIFTFYTLGLGGIQRLMIDLSNHIARLESSSKEKIRVNIILRKRDDFDMVKLLDCSDNIKVYYPPIIWGRKRVDFFYYLFLLIVKLRPVSVMSSLEEISTYVVSYKYLLFWRKFKVIIHQGNILSKSLISVEYKWFIKISIFFSRKIFIKNNNNILDKYISRFYSLADMVIVQTKYAKKDLLNKFGVKKEVVKVISNWTLMDYGKGKKKKKYDLIYIGRFSEQKNLMMMIDVVEKVRSKYGKLKVLMIGEGDMKRKIENEIEKRKLTEVVSLSPSKHDVYKYFHLSRMFILTSYYEGQPVALLESMACGLPSIVFNYPGASEYVFDSETGYVCDGVKTMSEKICKLIKNDKLREKMGTESMRIVKKKYGKENLEKYVKFLLN